MARSREDSAGNSPSERGGPSTRPPLRAAAPDSRPARRRYYDDPGIRRDGFPDPFDDSPMPIKTLLIEDDRKLAELIREFLAQHGVEAVVAPDGVQALSQLAQQRFDILLLDLM